MDPIGLMILIQPAMTCIVLGMTLFVVGITWILVVRRFSKKSTKIVAAMAIFLFSVIAFSLSIYLKFGVLPVYFEAVTPLSYSSVD